MHFLKAQQTSFRASASRDEGHCCCVSDAYLRVSATREHRRRAAAARARGMARAVDQRRGGRRVLRREPGGTGLDAPSRRHRPRRPGGGDQIDGRLAVELVRASDERVFELVEGASSSPTGPPLSARAGSPTGRSSTAPTFARKAPGASRSTNRRPSEAGRPSRAPDSADGHPPLRAGAADSLGAWTSPHAAGRWRSARRRPVRCSSGSSRRSRSPSA